MSAGSDPTEGSDRATSRPGGESNYTGTSAHRAVYIVVVAGLAALAVVIVATLADRKQRLAGTNGVAASVFVRVLDPQGKYCQPRQVVPSDADSVGILVGTYSHPRPRLLGTLLLGPDEVGHGVLLGGRDQGEVRMVLSHRRPGRYVATFCLSNVGRTRIALAGNPQPGAPVRLVWYRPGSESWLTLLPSTAKRFSLGRGVGRAGWAGPLAILLVIGAISTSIAVIVRTVP